MPEHIRQALPEEKEEAGCADNQPEPTDYVSDERQKFNVARMLRGVAVTLRSLRLAMNCLHE